MLSGIAPKDVVGPLVSMCAAVASVTCFVLSFRLSKRAANRSLNLEAQKMLLEFNRQLIADPRLWAIYDDHPIRTDPSFDYSSLHFQGKLEAIAYLNLNMFEVVLIEAPEPAVRGERNHSNVWLDFFYSTIERSSVTRAVLERPESARIYNRILLAHYERWKIIAKCAAPEEKRG